MRRAPSSSTPARTDAEVPPEFTEYSVRPSDSPTVSPDAIEKNAQDWIGTWTDITLR